MPKVPPGLGAALPEDRYLYEFKEIVYLPSDGGIKHLNPSPYDPKKINRKKDKKKRVNTGTEHKIEMMRQYRRECIKERRELPHKTFVCRMKGIGIDHKTVKKNAPELWAKWEDLDYDVEQIRN